MSRKIGGLEKIKSAFLESCQKFCELEHIFGRLSISFSVAQDWSQECDKTGFSVCSPLWGGTCAPELENSRFGAN